MYPGRRLIVLGALAFLCSLLAFLPARLALAVIPASPALQISAPAGSLWHGSARIVTASAGYDVSWDLQSWRLLVLGIGGDWRVSSAGLSAEGSVVVHPWGRKLVVAQAELAGPRLAQMFSRSAVTIDQPILCRDVAIAVAASGEVTAARGQCSWGPGTVKVASRPQPMAVPALHGRLEQVDGNLRLVVDGEPAPGETIATADADFRKGELHLVVLQRAADVVGFAEKGQRPPATTRRCSQTLPPCFVRRGTARPLAEVHLLQKSSV